MSNDSDTRCQSRSEDDRRCHGDAGHNGTHWAAASRVWSDTETLVRPVATQTLTLTDFLLARIAEDEAWAQEALDLSEGIGETREWRWVRLYNRGSHSFYMGAPEPTRVLAECEAKRQIVEMHHVGDPEEWQPELQACRLCQWDEDCDSPKQDHQYAAGRFPCPTLRALALPYADHPDYREEWRP